VGRRDCLSKTERPRLCAELWTTRSLATHLREHCQHAGHPSLAKLGRGTVSKIFSKAPIQPHKIAYYLERRDPNFDEKLDNHSAHISKETRTYLATRPNRFEFVFTPTHGSWLNIIETFFSKMTRQFLRGIRVNAKEELIQRLLKYLDEINETPVVFKWKYKLDELSVV